MSWWRRKRPEPEPQFAEVISSDIAALIERMALDARKAGLHSEAKIHAVLRQRSEQEEHDG